MPTFRFTRLMAALAPAAALALALAAPARAAGGTGWNVVLSQHYGASGNYSGYSALAAVAPDDVWAFGSTNEAGFPPPGTPVAEHWNGSGWAASPLPAGLTSEINAVSVVSASDIWAVTEVGGDILHWDGSAWSVADHVTGNPGGTFTDVTAVSSTDVWVFGFSPAGPGLGTWHFDGKTWTSVTGSASMVVTASAVSANDIWAISDTASGIPALVRYGGTTWSRIKNAPALSYQGILALSASDVWATGSDTSNRRWLAHMSSGAWTKVELPWTGLSLGYLVPDGSGGLWLSALGSGGTSWILHYSASGHWSRTAFTATIIPLAQMPGTTSALAGGWVNTSTGANATVWAHGTL